VPTGQQLVIEPGVEILIQTVEAFTVRGSLQMNGTADQPIVIEAAANWNGLIFDLPLNSDARQVLHYVMIDPSGPIPSRVIFSMNAHLEITGCHFIAKRICLDVYGGSLSAESDTMKTVGIYSTVVSLWNLTNELPSYLVRSYLVAWVTEGDEQPGFPMTAGLVLRDVRSIALYDSRSSLELPNTIVVHAPYDAVGVHLSGCNGIDLRYAIITVRSPNGTAKGIFHTGGSSQVVHCHMDIGDPGSAADMPYGLIAQSNTTILVNSSTVHMSSGNGQFFSDGDGILTVDYSVISSSAGLVAGLGDRPMRRSGLDNSYDDPTGRIHLMAHNIFADPGWNRVGEWGTWHDYAGVYAYYSLQPTSECIDHGDSTYGFDPDNSLPDIGCFYYEGSPAYAHDRPAGVLSEYAMAPAYPNPFNPATTVPIALARGDFVNVTLFDVLGREVGVVLSGYQTAGEHRVVVSGNGLASGVYMLSLQVGGAPAAMQRLVLLK
jgi:hypothetical protein